MVVTSEDMSVHAKMSSKSHLRRSLVRHTSMPASPVCSPPSSEYGQNRFDRQAHQTRQRGTTPWLPSKTQLGLVNELPLARSLSSSLRRDRDRWRSIARKQELDLIAAQLGLDDQVRLVNHLKCENARLHDQPSEHITTATHRDLRMESHQKKYNELVTEHNDVLRTMTCLKRSDRAKGKVQQRNLVLKATLHRLTTQPSVSDKIKADEEAGVREALAEAVERIEELESTGEILLEALEQSGDNDNENDADDNMSPEIAKPRLLEVKLTFRNVLDDDTFKEQKENWAGLLDE